MTFPCFDYFSVSFGLNFEDDRAAQDAFTVWRSGKNLENLDCVAPFVLYLRSGAGPAAALFKWKLRK